MSRKAVLITGGARRIGAAISLYFAEQGYDVALHYHRSKDASKIKKKIEVMGRKCELFPHDLHKISGIPALMNKVKKTMPHCVALINNASIFERAELMQTDEALLDRQFMVNLKAPFFMTQAFAKHFEKGAVINILDTNIVQTHGSHFAYLLSKKTLADFTVMAARALGPKIRVNGVCPGAILPASAKDKEYTEKLKSVIPLKNHPSPMEVAAAAAWLIEQKHITGQLIFVDGGQHVL
jgi:pteridine reductase